MTGDIKEIQKSIVGDLTHKLAPNVKEVWKWVTELKKENPKLSKSELADFIGDQIIWTYAKQGAALALPGAIPGLGTLAQIVTEVGAASVDLALMIRNQSYLVFAIGHCYGIKGREILIQDSLICIGLWTNALILSKSGTIRIGKKVVEANFKKRFPAKIFQLINRRVGTTIITKYGVKRGGVAVGKTIPFGVGVLIGGGFNYLMMKKFKKDTINYLSLKVAKKKRMKRKGRGAKRI